VVTLIDRPGVTGTPPSGFGCGLDNFQGVLLDDDGGFPAIETTCGAGTTFPAGTYSPNNPLSAFDGENADGTWTLSVTDWAGADTGTLNNFALVFSTGCPTATPTATGTATPTATPTATSTPTPTATPTGTPGLIQFAQDIYIDDETDTAVIGLVRDQSISSGTDVVTVTPSGGTATGGASCAPGIDYINTPQNATFDPGELTESVSIVLCGDGLVEVPNETVGLTLTGSNTRPGEAPDVDTATLVINDTANVNRNPAPICTNLGTQADIYPSNIVVTNGPTQIGGIRVTLYDFFHIFPDNIDVLLVGPGGQEYVMMADAGGAIPIDPTAPVTLTFADFQPVVLPDSGPLTTGQYEPTVWEPGQSNFPPPAPPGPYAEADSAPGGPINTTFFGNFGLTPANGTWSLYVRDDAGNLVAVSGCINGGWGIEFVDRTAAGVSVSGRVMTAEGEGVRNARMTITGGTLTEPRVVTTSSFGYYNFEGLEAGQTYILTVEHPQFAFANPTRVISLIDNISDADFIAQPEE
jgi:hypothetical protein